MPQLVTYRGRPVKHRKSVTRRGCTGLLLTLYAPQVGQRGDTLFVTDAEWQQFGSVKTVENMPDVRALAASTANNSPTRPL